MTDWPPPQRCLLPDGRLHLSDGPIDLVIGLEGTRPAIQSAREAAFRALCGVLPALAAELPLLRSPLLGRPPEAKHPVACRMVEACWPLRASFITPMAAVAGAVAEHVLAAIAAVPGVSAAHVNNGGDIAVHLTPGASLRVGLAERPDRPGLGPVAHLRAEDGVGGVATSGWRGRSFSLGIADAVTVLAPRAAEADAAATLIANAVNAEHPAILRRPAEELDPDTDLAGQGVTVAVGDLPAPLLEAALDAGLRQAELLLARGQIRGAFLSLGGRMRVTGTAEIATLGAPAAFLPEGAGRAGRE
ncbi:UPF0280 family protein [Sabulicella glaciei]|uniref:UPF0280 family protein n=1 Tax=Sabulicella glaciei TaxID=2984948 RepID=A0ABT3NQM3_9PROT|nr:UPF0280 family protein [Roseococcus sp. MDT2-1-1]